MHAGEEDHACTALMDNIKTWTGLTVEDSVRMAEDRDKWRKYVHGVANDRKNRTERTQPRANYSRCMTEADSCVGRSVASATVCVCV